MTTITREWLQQTISEFENTRDDIPFGLDDDDAKILKVLKLALASMDARPVAWMCEDEEGREYNSSNEFSCGRFGVPLYAAPPAPVSVPDGLKQAVEFYEQVKQENIPVETGAWKDAVNWVLEEACRAAMLQANQRDLSQPVGPQVAEYEQIMLQAGWVMVPVEPTEEMIAAAMECEDVLFNSDGSFCVQFREIYCAMVDAALALNKGEY
ncbi:TPA: hypothetical protein ACJGM6_000003 [Salmonella enterica subsp. enterica serovar Muenchen]